VKAGTTARPALWPVPTADGATVRLRCTVTIGENTWGPVVSEMKSLGKPRIVTATDRRIEAHGSFLCFVPDMRWVLGVEEGMSGARCEGPCDQNWQQATSAALQKLFRDSSVGRRQGR
jgi:hypothetical protein